MKVYCRTNIDIFRGASFPTELIAVPEIGSRVRAIKEVYYRDKNGDTKNIPALELYVVGVVHGQQKDYNYTNLVPYVEIELHHPNAVELGWIF